MVGREVVAGAEGREEQRRPIAKAVGGGTGAGGGAGGRVQSSVRQRMRFSQCHGDHSPATRPPQPELAEVAPVAKARHRRE